MTTREQQIAWVATCAAGVVAGRVYPGIPAFNNAFRTLKTGGSQ